MLLASLHLPHTLWPPSTHTDPFLWPHPPCSSFAWWNADFCEDPGPLIPPFCCPTATMYVYYINNTNCQIEKIHGIHPRSEWPTALIDTHPILSHSIPSSANISTH